MNGSVLFVCTANRFRSVIAKAKFIELIKRSEQEGTWRVDCAGTWTVNGLPPAPSARWIEDHLFLDVWAHRSKMIDQALMNQFRLVVVMASDHKEALQAEFRNLRERVFLLSELSTGHAIDITDPISGTKQDFLLIGREIISYVENGFSSIYRLGSELE